MSKYKIVTDNIRALVKTQNPKIKFKIIHDILNDDDIQIDIVCDDINLNIRNVSDILNKSGFTRLFLTVGKRINLSIFSDNYAYVIRTDSDCNVKSIYHAKNQPIFMKLGENTSLIYDGTHDIKNNKNCKITHVSKATYEQCNSNS